MTKDDDKDAPLKVEAALARQGINPMFGEWRHRFGFSPVPHGGGGGKALKFQQKIREDLINIKWLYSHEVRLEITLHLDVQDILETSDTADLDNYAKAILDGLKGPGGIMFDDTQVQSLGVSWLDTYDEPYFTVEAKSSPDDFILKPIEFFEMPDDLWYPIALQFWTQDGPKSSTELERYFGLCITEMMSVVKKRYRMALRKAGNDRLRAYQNSLFLSSAKRGYHKSRIDTGFTMHKLRDWQVTRDEWRSANPEAAKGIDDKLAGPRQAFDSLTALLNDEA
jgi:Endodeoxyribonuclease RusA